MELPKVIKARDRAAAGADSDLMEAEGGRGCNPNVTESVLR